MNYQKYIFGLFLLIIPLIILVIFYKNYVYAYCNNDLSCLKKKLINNLNSLSLKINDLPKKENDTEDKNEHFTGIISWFSGNNVSQQLPISASDTLSSESLTALEKKISEKTRISSSFPPTNDTDNDDKEYSDNLEIINKPYLTKNKNIVSPLVDKTISQVAVLDEVNNSSKSTKINIPKPDIKSLFGNCNFFNDKCPSDYHPLGNFSIGGLGNNTVLQCGQVQNYKTGAAVAIIKNNHVEDIKITDQGHGYNPSSPPKIKIEGGKGTSAKAEAIIDDNGFLKVIKVTNSGYNYAETPTIIIDSPYVNSSCHLCCKNE